MKLVDKDKLTPHYLSGYTGKDAWITMIDPEDATNISAASTSYYEESGSADDWMITPAIQLPEDKDACQLFYRSRASYNTFRDGHVVYAIDADANPEPEKLEKNEWKAVSRITALNEKVLWDFKKVDLSAFAGKKIYLAFVNNTSEGWILYIDDIYICSEESLPKASILASKENIVSGNEATIYGKIHAGIKDAVKGFSVKLTSEGEEILETFSDVEIEPNKYYSFSLTDKLKKSSGETRNFHLEVIQNDEVIAEFDGTIRYAMALDADRLVVVESLYGSNNGRAPRAYEGLKKLSSIPTKTIGIIYHGPNSKSDNLTPENTEYQKTLTDAKNLSYNSNAIANRTALGEIYDNILDICDEANTAPIVKGSILAKCDGNNLEVSGTFTPAISLTTEDISYEIVLTEDNVPGMMYNSYSGGNVSFNGYENMGSDISVTYDNVFKAGYSDTNMKFDKSVKAGDVKDYSFKTTYKSGISTELGVNSIANLKATVLFLRKSTGEILNAARCDIDFSEYEQKVANITTTSGSHGSISVSSRTVEFGKSVTFTISPDTGYEIASAKLNGQDVLSQISGNKLIVKNVDCDLHLEVTFSNEAYKVTVTCGEGGTATASKSRFSYGDKIVLAIKPNEGYVLDRLKQNGQTVTSSVVNNQYVIDNAAFDLTFDVTFKKKEFSINIDCGEEGSVKCSSSIALYGEDVTFTITCNDGYEIEAVSFNNKDVTADVSNNTFVAKNIKGNVSLKVRFKQIGYKVTVKNNKGGSVTASASSVSIGGFVSFAITANEGYYIEYVKLNGGDITDLISSSGIYNELNVANDLLFEVSFKKYEFKVSSTSSKGGKVVQSLSKVGYGDSVTFTIVPDKGYCIESAKLNGKDVTSNISSEGLVYTMLVTSNLTFEVSFRKIEYAITTSASEGGIISQSTSVVTYGDSIVFTIVPDEGYTIESATLNGYDVTEEIVDSIFVCKNITENIEFNVSFAQTETGINNVDVDKMDISCYNDIVVISNINVGEILRIYSISGLIVHEIHASANQIEVKLNKNNTYILTIGAKSTTISIK